MAMKKLLLLIMSCVLMIACSKTSDEIDQNGGKYVDIEFNAYSVEHTSMDSLSTRVAIGDVFSSLDFVIYSVTDDAYSVFSIVRQSKSNADFGHIKLSKVPYGVYKVVAVGHNCSSPAVFNSPEYVDFGGKVNETFVAYKDITIDGGTDVSQSLMLKRITSMFMLRINDVQPSNIASVDFLLTGASTNFNPSTGLSYSTSATVRTIHVDVSSFAGKTNVELFFHMFLPTDAATVTIVANFMDADGNTLLTKQFSPVEMGVNEKTIYSGNIYSQERSYMVDVDDTWRRTNEISF